MTLQETMAELEALGSESIRKVLRKHGARDPFFGVRIGDMKPLLKRAKGDQALVRALWASGNSDAMYLAVLLADPAGFSKEELEAMVAQAYWPLLAEDGVAKLAAEGPYGRELGLAWIEREEEMVASAGWATLGGRCALLPDAELDLEELRGLLAEAVRRMPTAKNRVRYCVNNFVLAVGAYVLPLLEEAKAAARAMGPVEVDMGGTSCAVPAIVPYLEKMEAMGKLGKKRKALRC